MYLELGEREASSRPYAAIVFNGGAADYGSEFVDWARCYCSSFGKTGVSTTRLASRLDNTVSEFFVLPVAAPWTGDV